MTKKEFTQRICRDHGVPYTHAHSWVNAIFDTLGKCLIDNPEVNIYGFGKFEQRKRAAKRRGRPDGTTYICPPTIKLWFSPSVYISDAVKDGLDSGQFDMRMEKIRALKRGEYVPGYELHGDQLVEVEIQDDPFQESHGSN